MRLLVLVAVCLSCKGPGEDKSFNKFSVFFRIKVADIANDLLHMFYSPVNITFYKHKFKNPVKSHRGQFAPVPADSFHALDLDLVFPA